MREIVRERIASEGKGSKKNGVREYRKWKSVSREEERKSKNKGVMYI